MKAHLEICYGSDTLMIYGWDEDTTVSIVDNDPTLRVITFHQHFQPDIIHRLIEQDINKIYIDELDDIGSGTIQSVTFSKGCVTITYKLGRITK